MKRKRKSTCDKDSPHIAIAIAIFVPFMLPYRIAANVNGSDQKKKHCKMNQSFPSEKLNLQLIFMRIFNNNFHNEAFVVDAVLLNRNEPVNTKIDFCLCLIPFRKSIM